MIKTRRAQDNEITVPNFMFTGNAGTGKTTMIAKAAKFLVNELKGKFLVINMEPKDRTATPDMLSCPPEVEVLDNPKWTDIMELSTGAYLQYKAGIGIDGFDGYCRESFYDILGVASKPRFNIGQDFMGNQNAWHIQGHRMINHIKGLLDKGIPIIATCRLAYDNDEVRKTTFVRTTADGKSGLEVPPLFTVLGLCYYRAGAKEEWRIKFRPEYDFPARDTGGRLLADEPADFAYLWNKVTGHAVPVDVGTQASVKPTPIGGIKR
jgi:hypothetical protein